MRELEQCCDADRKRAELALQEKAILKGQLDQLREQVIDVSIPIIVGVFPHYYHSGTAIKLWSVCVFWGGGGDGGGVALHSPLTFSSTC